METLDSYRDLRKTLSREEFVRRHPHPFLVRGAAPVGLSKTADFLTLNVNLKEDPAAPAPGAPDAAAGDVFKMVRRDTGAFDGQINVGRVTTNDLTLNLQAVSKFHAFFSRDDATGDCSVTDAGSTNGTAVAGVKIERGIRRQLAEGEEVVFGKQAAFTFYSAGGFYDFLGGPP